MMSMRLEVQKLLLNQKYVPSPYIIKLYKTALVRRCVRYKPNYFPDQIIHWALMLQIQPVIMRECIDTLVVVCRAEGRATVKNSKKMVGNDIKNTNIVLKWIYQNSILD